MAETKKPVPDLMQALKESLARAVMAETKNTPELSEASYLTTDNDSHWYVVPVAKRAEWEEWLEIDPDDERAWGPPAFARPVGGGPSLVEFSSWSIR